MFKTPVLFLIFNRLDTTEQVFTKIREIKPIYFYVAADGPRNNKNGEKEKCEKVKKFVSENIDWECEVKTLFREQNLGCGKAVSSAITWFFENVKEGIILEDDCLPDLSFFRFCEELLEKYRNNEKIISICGTNVLPDFSDGHSYIFSLYGGNWGWASWRRSWTFFNYEMYSWSNIENQKIVRKNLKSENEFLGIKKLFDYMILENRLDIWDFQWFYARLLNNKLTILPTKNLVKNIGFGISATHTSEQESWLNQLSLNKVDFPLIHNKNIKPNRKFDKGNSKMYGWYVSKDYIKLLNHNIKKLMKNI
jgi:hypothetical protein